MKCNELLEEPLQGNTGKDAFNALISAAQQNQECAIRHNALVDAYKNEKGLH